MKKRFFPLVSFVVIVCAVMFTGCETMTSTSTTSAVVTFTNEGAFGQHILIPMKDFESLGLVFTTAELQTNTRGANSAVTGETFTYYALLQEARKLNADAIINVTIDKRNESVSSDVGLTRTETWYGSALAIKYTDVIKLGPNETIYINDGRSQSSAGGTGVSVQSTDGVAEQPAAPPSPPPPSGRRGILLGGSR